MKEVIRKATVADATRISVLNADVQKPSCRCPAPIFSNNLRMTHFQSLRLSS